MPFTFLMVLGLSCLLSGVASAWLPAPLVLAAVGGTMTVAGVGVMGRLVNARRRPLLPAMPASTVVQAEAAADFRLARVLFYLGLASLGQLTLRPVFATTASDFLFLAALLAMLVTPRRTLPLSYGWSPLLLLGVGLFTLGAVLSTFNAEHRAAGAVVTIKFVYLTAVWFWLAAQLLTTEGHLRTATNWWIASIALSGAVALVQFLTGSWLPEAAFEWTRMPGTGQHVNDLGGMAAVALVPALILRGDGFRRLLRLVAGGMIFVGLLLSGAVAGLLAAVASLVAWVAIKGAYVRGLLVAVALLAAGVMLYGTAADTDIPTPLSRLQQVTGSRGDPQSTAWSRLETFEASIERIARNPIVGTGMSAEDATTSTGHVVHNVLIGPFDRAGVFGFLGMLLLLGAVARSAVVGVREARTAGEHELAVALLSALVAFLVFGMTAPILFQRYGWVAAVLLHANYCRLTSVQHVTTASLERQAR